MYETRENIHDIKSNRDFMLLTEIPLIHSVGLTSQFWPKYVEGSATVTCKGNITQWNRSKEEQMRKLLESFTSARTAPIVSPIHFVPLTFLGF